MTYTVDSFMHLTTTLLPTFLAQSFSTQTEADPAQTGASFLFVLVAYLFSAFCCWKIFQKCGVENAWFAWVPILGTYACFQAGDEENPLLWTILSIVPCVNIIAAVKLIMAWIKICGKIGKSPWLLLVCLIPLGAFFVLGYFAFT